MKRGIKTHFSTARLVGLVTLVLAIIAHLSGAGSNALFFAAIVVLVAPTKYCQERLEKIAEIDVKKILITTLYDALFWALFLVAGYGAAWKLRTLSESILGTTTVTQATMINPQTAAATLETAQGLVFTIVTLFAFLLVFSLLTNALTRSLIWSTLADEKWNKKYFISFLKLTAAWWAFWLIPFGIVIVALSKNPPVLTWAITVLGVIGIYFTFFIHTTFLSRKKIGASISHGIAFALSKFYHLLVPLSFALIVYVIAYQALRAVQFLPTIAAQPIMIAFALVFISWLRAYAYSTLPNFSKE